MVVNVEKLASMGFQSKFSLSGVVEYDFRSLETKELDGNFMFIESCANKRNGHAEFLQRLEFDRIIGVPYSIKVFARPTDNGYDNIVFTRVKKELLPQVFSFDSKRQEYVLDREFEQFASSNGIVFSLYKWLYDPLDLVTYIGQDDAVRRPVDITGLNEQEIYDKVMERNKLPTVERLSDFIVPLDNEARRWVHERVYERTPFDKIVRSRLGDIKKAMREARKAGKNFERNAFVLVKRLDI